MIKILSICILITVITCTIHSLTTRIVFKSLDRLHLEKRRHRMLLINLVVICIVVATFLEVSVWAGFYYFHHVLINAEESFYFSLVTYTTLGYGDIVLTSPYRIYAGFEAANGIIIFGWSTAIFMWAIQKSFNLK